MTFQLKIQIKGITKPPVWRKLLVPSNFTFDRFHIIIQIAFGWDDSHLYQFGDMEDFRSSSQSISIPSEGDWKPVKDSRKVKLNSIFKTEGQKYLYIYDFGDSWEHQITLETILPDDLKKAKCIGGKGACPPEDCGGVWEYEDMKAILKNEPDSDEAKEYRDWLGLENDEDWETVNGFDIEEVNEVLEGM
jgi:hypothetical protein